eukprot:GEZU01021286.1.p1 GENE.GEZU01021286.1~~GEZU01021286.1.p1  ORF type:complete len:253 (-),score=47.27 GEZU01021286.1:216-974(-)
MIVFFVSVFAFTIVSIIISTFLIKGKETQIKIKNLLGVGIQRAKKLLTEFKRKTFHLLGLLIPCIYYYGTKFGFLTRMQTVYILGAIFAVLFTLDLLRLYVPPFREFYMKVAGKIMRAKEANRINGTTFYVAGCALTILFFNPIIAVCSILFLNLGDLSAAMVGMSMGRTKIAGGKSVEGTLANFVVCFFIGVVCFSDRIRLFEYISMVGALSATVTELVPLFGIDDNFTIPLVAGFFMTLAHMRLGEDLRL